MTPKYCLDCGVEIYYTSTRCQSCSMKYRWAQGLYKRDYNGERNPNWRGGNKRVCKYCGMAFVDKNYTRSDFCSKKCAGAYQHEQNLVTLVCRTCGCEFQVLPHDAEERKYCSVKCFANHPETKQRLSRVHSGKTIPEWQRQILSRGMSKRNAEQSYTYGKGGHHHSPKVGRVYYRSSYELRAYELLDENPFVAWYETEPVVIEYKNLQGLTRRYRPDLMVEWGDGTYTLVEIKPAWKMDDPLVLMKASAAFMWCMRWENADFNIWTETSLGLQECIGVLRVVPCSMRHRGPMAAM